MAVIQLHKERRKMIMTIFSIIMWLIAIFVASVIGCLAERKDKQAGQFFICVALLFIMLALAAQLAAVIQAGAA